LFWIDIFVKGYRISIIEEKENKMKKIAVFVFAAMIVLAPVAAQALSIGCWNRWPTVGQQFNDKLAGYLGYNYTSNYNNQATSWYLVKLDYNLVKLGDVQTKVGIDYWGSSPNTDSGVELTYGASIMAAKNLSVGFDIILAGSYNNPTSTDILPSANVAVNLYF
jgi:hypothetical protein